MSQSRAWLRSSRAPWFCIRPSCASALQTNKPWRSSQYNLRWRQAQVLHQPRLQLHPQADQGISTACLIPRQLVHLRLAHGHARPVHVSEGELSATISRHLQQRSLQIQPEQAGGASPKSCEHRSTASCKMPARTDKQCQQTSSQACTTSMTPTYIPAAMHTQSSCSCGALQRKHTVFNSSTSLVIFGGHAYHHFCQL